MKKHTGISRRTFMAGLGATVATPYIVPSSAIGADAPSKTINIGLIGCGGQGRGVMSNTFGMKGVRTLAVADVNKKNLAEAEKMVNQRYDDGKCATYHDFRDLLARDDIDAIICGTYDAWHAQVSILAARAGKDIYCEKPLTWSLGEGQQVVKEVRENNVILQVGSMQRSGGNFKRVCELVRNGYLGKITHINVGLPDGGHTLYVSEYPDPPEWVDYDFWLGPAAEMPYHPKRLDWDWRWHMNVGGSQMMDWIGHHGDIAHMAMDWDHTGPIKIEPELWTVPPQKNDKGEENLYNGPSHYRFQCTYKGGTTLTVASTNAMPEVYQECGDTGTQFFNDKGQWIFVSRGGVKASDEALLELKPGKDDFRFRREGNHIKDWLDCIVSREDPIAPVEAGHRSASIGHLGKIACTLNQTIEWKPKKEQIVDNDAAEAMISRVPRDGWDFLKA